MINTELARAFTRQARAQSEDLNTNKLPGKASSLLLVDAGEMFTTHRACFGLLPKEQRTGIENLQQDRQAKETRPLVREE